MKYLLLIAITGLLFACVPDKPKTKEEYPDQPVTKSADVITNPTKGIGAIKAVTLKTPIEQDRVSRGLAIYESHHLDAERHRAVLLLQPSP